MIPATVVGMALALGSLIATMLLEGTNPLSIVLLPPLVLVVVMVLFTFGGLGLLFGF